MSVKLSIQARLLLVSLAIFTTSACNGSEDAARAVAISCPPGMTPAAKQSICVHGLCGNGIVDEQEACDDGNIIAGDGCSQDCRSTESCGNGTVDLAVGEVCDDGNTAPDDRCCSDCRSCPELAVLHTDELATPAAVQVETGPEPCPPAPPGPGGTQTATARKGPEPAQTSSPRLHAHTSIRATSPPPLPLGRLAEQRHLRMGEELAAARRTIAELEQRNSALHQSLEGALRALTEAQQRLVRGITLR
jgi:cysteine-rich repeat protein